MRKVLTILGTMMVSITAIAGATEIRKSGDCKLQVADAFDKAKVFSVNVVSEQIDVLCEFRGGDFFGSFTVFAVPRITNKSGKPINVTYHVAFFDKAGELIAGTSQESDVKVDEKDFQLASCLAKVPKEKFDQITSYKLAIYLSEPKKKE